MKLTSKTINYTVDTIEQLLLTTGTENDTVIVTDENQGGVFIYREDNSSTNNGGTIFNGWTRQYDGAVNVKWFGAKGDGVTDDTAAIQKALDYCLGASTNLNFTLAESFYAVYTPLLLRGGNGIKIAGVHSGSIIKALASMDSVIKSAERVDNIDLDNIYIDGNNLSNYCLTTNEFYCPYWNISNCTFNYAIETQLSLQTFVTNISKVTTFRGNNGFEIKGVGGGPSTSVTMTACYANQASLYGYKFGHVTYCTLNSCACDATDIAYSFNNAYGVTMNSCGAERVNKFLKIFAYRGFVLNAPYILSAGTVASPPTNYLIEFISGKNATISGVEIGSVRDGGYTYLLGQTGLSYGSENITILDSSVSRANSFWVSNYNFARPIKFLRDDATNKDVILTLSDSLSFRSIIEKTANYEINNIVTWQLEDGVYDLTVGNSLLKGLKGNGVLIIRGNPLNNTLVTILSDYTDFGFLDCNVKVILRDLTISGLVGSGSNFRLKIDNSNNVVLDNTRIIRGSVNAGTGIRLENCSKVLLINGSIISGSFLTAPYTIDNSSKLLIEKASSAPTSGKWIVGSKVYNSSPSAGGFTGWICTTAGEPGTWKGFGLIQA